MELVGVQRKIGIFPDTRTFLIPQNRAFRTLLHTGNRDVRYPMASLVMT